MWTPLCLLIMRLIWVTFWAGKVIFKCQKIFIVFFLISLFFLWIEWNKILQWAAVCQMTTKKPYIHHRMMSYFNSYRCVIVDAILCFLLLVNFIFLSIIKCVCCSTGETLKHDINFKGPLSKRSCTDVLCLLIFIVFLGCWGFVAHYGKFFLLFVLCIFHKKMFGPNFFQHFLTYFQQKELKTQHFCN